MSSVFADVTVVCLYAGKHGNGDEVFDRPAQADSGNIRSALIGGVVFNLANILLIAAISIAGMSVAFPVGIGIALIWGVLDNYLKIPTGNPT